MYGDASIQCWKLKVKDIDLTGMCNRSPDVCGREPIHLSSAVQPHGVLVGLRARTLGVVTKSANVDAIFGNTPYGQCPSWLPQAVVANCRGLGERSGHGRTLVAEIPEVGQAETRCFAASGLVFCEFELPSAGSASFTLDNASLVVAKAMKEMEGAHDLLELAGIVARAVRALSGSAFTAPMSFPARALASRRFSVS